MWGPAFARRRRSRTKKKKGHRRSAEVLAGNSKLNSKSNKRAASKSTSRVSVPSTISVAVKRSPSRTGYRSSSRSRASKFRSPSTSKLNDDTGSVKSQKLEKKKPKSAKKSKHLRTRSAMVMLSKSDSTFPSLDLSLPVDSENRPASQHRPNSRRRQNSPIRNAKPTRNARSQTPRIRIRRNKREKSTRTSTSVTRIPVSNSSEESKMKIEILPGPESIEKKAKEDEVSKLNVSASSLGNTVLDVTQSNEKPKSTPTTPRKPHFSRRDSTDTHFSRRDSTASVSTYFSRRGDDEPRGSRKRGTSARTMTRVSSPKRVPTRSRSSKELLSSKRRGSRRLSSRDSVGSSEFSIPAAVITSKQGSDNSAPGTNNNRSQSTKSMRSSRVSSSRSFKRYKSLPWMPMSPKQTTDVVKVCCRFRPLKRERGKVERPSELWQINSSAVVYHKLKFSFSRVFDESTNQPTVYKATAEPLLQDFLRGYNCCIFAYGQTGTGKSFTMTGREGSNRKEDRGIVPRLLEDLCEKLKEDRINHPHRRTRLSVSFVEVYNEQIYDLLDPEFTGTGTGLSIRTVGGVHVEGVRKFDIKNVESTLQILREGNRNRSVTKTSLNDNSSRSHSVLQIDLHQNEDSNLTACKMLLVDLAGSERVKRTNATGNAQKEGSCINKSLTTLGKVIQALAKKQMHVPFRDSKLTLLLSECIHGNCKLCVIMTASRCMEDAEETISSLRFGSYAAGIKNQVVANRRLDPKAYKKMFLEAKGVNGKLSGACRVVLSLLESDTGNASLRQRVEIAIRTLKDVSPLMSDNANSHIDVSTLVNTLKEAKNSESETEATSPHSKDSKDLRDNKNDEKDSKHARSDEKKNTRYSDTLQPEVPGARMLLNDPLDLKVLRRQKSIEELAVEELMRENVRLSRENSHLKSENHTLQRTISSLRSSKRHSQKRQQSGSNTLHSPGDPRVSSLASPSEHHRRLSSQTNQSSRHSIASNSAGMASDLARLSITSTPAPTSNLHPYSSISPSFTRRHQHAPPTKGYRQATRIRTVSSTSSRGDVGSSAVTIASNNQSSLESPSPTSPRSAVSLSEIAAGTPTPKLHIEEPIRSSFIKETMSQTRVAKLSIDESSIEERPSLITEAISSTTRESIVARDEKKIERRRIIQAVPLEEKVKLREPPITPHQPIIGTPRENMLTPITPIPSPRASADRPQITNRRQPSAELFSVTPASSIAGDRPSIFTAVSPPAASARFTLSPTPQSIMQTKEPRRLSATWELGSTSKGSGGDSDL